MGLLITKLPGVQYILHARPECFIPLSLICNPDGRNGHILNHWLSTHRHALPASISAKCMAKPCRHPEHVGPAWRLAGSFLVWSMTQAG